MTLTPVRSRWKVHVDSCESVVVGARCVRRRERLAQSATLWVEASDGYQPEFRSPASMTALSVDCKWCRIRCLAVSCTYVRGLESRRFDLWSQDSV